MSLFTQWKQGRIEKAQARAWDAFAKNDAVALGIELDAGADANMVNGAGQTLVHRMILENRPLLEKVLTRESVNWAAPLPDGRTILHLAVESGQSRWVKLALDRGVPIDLPNQAGHTALHLASRAGTVQLIRMLDAAGASWTSQDNRSKTPLNLLVAHPVLHATWLRLLAQRPIAS
jgi:ankyrin repeat protein